MSVFISWSGKHSKAAAVILKEWLENVIQSSNPWMSDVDIAAGSRPLEEIKDKLCESSAGIICITPGNWTQPWINYEVGALANSHRSEYVIPVTFGTDISEIVGPIAQFQAVKFSAEDMQKLAHSVNNSLADSGVTHATVDRACDKWWPELKAQIDQINFLEEAPREQRNTDDIVREILHHVRELSNDASSRRAKDVFRNKPAYLNRFTQDEVKKMNSEFNIPEDYMRVILGSHSTEEKLAAFRDIQTTAKVFNASLPIMPPPAPPPPPPAPDRFHPPASDRNPPPERKD